MSTRRRAGSSKTRTTARKRSLEAGPEAERILGLCSAVEMDRPPATPGARAVFQTSSRWDLGSTLVIRFLDGGSDLHGLVEQHARQWAPLTGLTFQFIGPNDVKPSHVRVAFTAGQGVRAEEFSSLIGRDALIDRMGRPTVKLGFTPRVLQDPKDARRLILHEFGHAIGLLHEHQNPAARIRFNAGALVQEYAKFGWTPAMVQSNIIDRLNPAAVEHTAFDDKSVMLYAFDSRFATPETRTNTEISALDKQLVRKMYEVDGPIEPVGDASTQPEPGLALTLGTPSDEVFYFPVHPIFFHFKADAKADYVAQTISTQPWTMTLLGPGKLDKVVAVDEVNSGTGPNAEIRKTLNPGTYFLKVEAQIKNLRGSLRVRVAKA